MTTPLRFISNNGNFVQWERGQTIPVRLINIPAVEQDMIINYCIAKINSLPLDIKLVPSRESQAITGGISITFEPNIGYISTRAVYGASTTPQQGDPYIFDICGQSIKVSSVILNGYKPPEGYNQNANYERALKNAVLHELLHAIGVSNHQASYVRPATNNRPPKIVFSPLMSPGLSSSLLEWTYSDEIRLLWMYGTNPSTRSKKFTFKQADIGKWCFLLHDTNKNMSISFKITSTEMVLEYFIKGPYKQAIMSVEVSDD